MDKQKLLAKKGWYVAGLALAVACWAPVAEAQVSSVTFGKNRIQYRKYNWRFYQTENFNVHFTEGGLELAKYVLQVAEEELPQLEAFTETALQRRANVVLYNSYDDMQASNIGLGNPLNDVGGLTRLVNNKMLIYFNGNHADLKRQIREGIAQILMDNRLFGENIGEIAGNATLLDLPKWLTDGYVAYAAEPWSIAKDDALKNALLAADYRSFYAFAFKEPTLAGHAFWNYIANTYKPENVTYFLYLAILYKNLNNASLRVCKKKFKDVLKDFMEAETDRYYKDIRGRRNYPKGSISITEDVDENKDFYHFAPNPNPRSFTYAVAEYKKGMYSVALYENYVNRKVLIKNGIRTYKHERNPNYPIMNWDGKGSRLAVVYWEKDKTKLMVYDIVNANVVFKEDLPFDQVQDAQYFLDHKRLIMSAVKNGHTDIFIYNLETRKVDQITNDTWDDLDASFVSFPNKYGILFASNRPSPTAGTGDTSVPSDNRYNIFMIDVDDKGGGFRQITQLTNLKYGNARYPTQYNVNHFTFVSDENGVGNRYAGFFTTKAEGLDTMLYIGDQVLRNPTNREIDSTLKAWERDEPDSIGIIALTRDSTYSFPLTNYESSLLETRIAGDKGQVSEVTQQSGVKMLYRLRVDSVALRRRNINPAPTEYVKRLMTQRRQVPGGANIYQQKKVDTTGTSNKTFLGEFVDQADTTTIKPIDAEAILAQIDAHPIRKQALKDARLFKYRLRFSNDMILAGATNNIILNRYQPYAGANGPIYPNNGNNLSWALFASLSDIMEDYRITGGVKPGINFTDNEYYVNFMNYRRRLDWGGSYYKASTSSINVQLPGTNLFYPGRINTNLYEGHLVYPLDRVRSVRLTTGLRFDRIIIKALDTPSLKAPDRNLKFWNTRLEYVHDNALERTQNIWNGLRYKFYIDNILQLEKPAGTGVGPRQHTLNFGGDARYYVPIYRNFIWALRGAFDVSWGNSKLIYFLGGADNWISPKFNTQNRPDPTVNYIYQSLAVNMRGFQQNVTNGNNALVINSELRLPVFTTLFNKPINNAFLRNFQLVQFVDLGSAWEGTFSGIQRPSVSYRSNDANNPVLVRLRAGGLGPFAGGYGFGARSTLLGYFMKVDAAWPMTGIFKGKPIWYFALGLDF